MIRCPHMRRAVLIVTHAIILSPLIYSSALINNFIAARQLWVLACFVIATALLCVYLWRTGAHFSLHASDAALGALLVIATIASLVSSADIAESFWSTAWRGTGLLLWWLWLMWFVVARTQQWNDREWRGMYVSHAVALLGSALIVFIQFFNPEFIPLSNGDRPSGLLGNSVFLGLYAAPYVFLPWYVVPPEKKWRWGAAFVSASALLIILITQARASLLALALGGVVGFGTLLWKSRRDALYARTRRIVAVVAVCAMVGFVSLATYGQLTSSDKIKRLTFNINYLATLKSRFVNWGVAFDAAADRPLVGWGFEQYRTAVEKHYSPELAKYSFMETRIDKPHNVYVEWLVMSGVLGLAAYLVLCGCLLWFAVRVKQPVAAAAWIAAVTTILMQEFFAFFTMQTILMLGFLLLIMDRDGDHVWRSVNISALPARSRAWALPGVLIGALLAFVLWRGVWGAGVSAYYTQQAVDAQANGDGRAIVAYVTRALDYMQVGPYPFETWRWAAHALLTDAAAGRVPQDTQWRTQVARLAAATTELASRHGNSAHWLLFAGKIEYHLALALDDRTHLDVAQNYFERAIAISPQRQESHLMLVYVHTLRGEYAQALEQFKQASVVASDFEMVNAIDFVARRLEKEKNYPMLVALYEWRASHTSTASAFAVLAAAYKENKQYAQARAAVERAVQLDPSFADEAAAFLATLPK